MSEKVNQEKDFEGKTIRELMDIRMKEKDLTLNALHVQSGVAYATIHNIYSGVASVFNLTFKSVYPLLKVLEVNVDELYSCAENSAKSKVIELNNKHKEDETNE